MITAAAAAAAAAASLDDRCNGLTMAVDETPLKRCVAISRSFVCFYLNTRSCVA